MHDPLGAAFDGVAAALMLGGAIWLLYTRMGRHLAWRRRPEHARALWASRLEIAGLLSAGIGFAILAVLRL